MENYRHTQAGHVINATLGASLFFISAGFVWSFLSGQTVAAIATGGVWFVLLLCLILFSSLTVALANGELELSFGPGVIRKRFALAEIASWRAVRNPWYYGWGIHLTPGGWLFNVSGFDAIELTMANGRKYRIGTDVPQELDEAIRRSKALQASETGTPYTS